ncbi:protein ALP1-like [Vigna umbellata]|uniref:protein ALP1-like n=1 Tax=Vigna umbellata TaxID=87088 RepID=UPI001F5EF033|nr:protein ALP1-like [Vigna umbellata]
MLCIVGDALNILNMCSSDPSSVSSFVPDKDRRKEQLMSYLVHTNRCCDIIRMGPEAFINLCERLRTTGLVKDAIRSTLEEQPSGDEVHPYVLNNSRFYPYFKDCLEAINGTHVRVRVPRTDAPRFRGRKVWPTQNVFVACDFEMKFTYVLAGWKGTTSDSRILKKALDRDDPLVIPQGKYYLGDAGFMLKTTVMTPYRGVRYHLKELTRRGAQNLRKLFNHRHSSLRNVIERTFGVLKTWFPIIASGIEPHYGLEILTDIILACCILHKFISGVDNDDPLLIEVDKELNEREGHNVSSSQVREDDYRLVSTIRDAIADEMWRDYQNSYLLFNMDKGKGVTIESSRGTRKFIKWTEDMDARLLHSMIEETRLDNRFDGS